MKALIAHEPEIDQCILEFDQAIRRTSIVPGKKIDFAEHTRYEWSFLNLSPSHRVLLQARNHVVLSAVLLLVVRISHTMLPG